MIDFSQVFEEWVFLGIQILISDIYKWFMSEKRQKYFYLNYFFEYILTKKFGRRNNLSFLCSYI